MPSACGQQCWHDLLHTLSRMLYGSLSHALFDRGTLILHPPPPGKAWIDYAIWDDRVERFRIPALYYRRLVEALTAEGTTLVDSARSSVRSPSYRRWR